MRSLSRRLVGVAVLTLLGSLVALPANAGHGFAHATIKYWAVGADPVIRGYDPHETTEDIEGVTGHVSTPDAPLTLVTSMENTVGGYCGPLYWNPVTNDFKTYPVTGGFQAAIDVNREAPVLTQGSKTFQPGDVWMTVNGNSSYAVYVNFKNSDNFRRYPVTSFLGVRVNQKTGLVYTAGFNDGKIYELDPSTNASRSWTVGNRPYWLDIDDDGNVYTAAAAAGGFPDQVVRLAPAGGELRRWNLPGGGLQSYTSFGMPNGVRVDPEGNLWVSQTTIDTVAMLDVSANEFIQYAEPGMSDPNGISASGTGGSLQAFFTERNANFISLINAFGSAGSTPVPVTPAITTLAPATTAVSPVDFTVAPRRNTITPATFASDGDAPDIIRFPAPATVSGPAGISRVAEARTIYGSFEGSDHVFRLESDAIVATPPGTAAEAYTARARVDALPLDTGKVNRAFVGSVPASDDKTVLSQSIPTVVSVGVAHSNATTRDLGPRRVEADGRHSVVEVDLLASTITADVVTAKAHAEFDGATNARTANAAGSGFVNLNVAGNPVSDGVPANTSIAVPGVGTVVLNEQILTITSRGASMQVNMIHFTNYDGSLEVIVSSAFAGAGKTTVPGDAGMVLPEVPEPPPTPGTEGTEILVKCITGDPVMEEGFEAGLGSFTTDNASMWEAGAPTWYTGPLAAASGAGVAGTLLAGPFPFYDEGSLISPSIDLRSFDPAAPGPCSGKKAVIEFKQWFASSFYDCGYIEVSTDGGTTYGQVDPTPGYNTTYTGYCGFQIYPPSGRSFTTYYGSPGLNSWNPYSVDLTPFAGKKVLVRFRFGGYSPVYNEDGWSIDDVVAKVL